MTAGAVNQKLNEAPPLVVVRATAPRPDGPYVGTEKSAATAMAGPEAPMTVMVHEMGSLTRTYVVAPFVSPTQDSVEATVAKVG